MGKLVSGILVILGFIGSLASAEAARARVLVVLSGATQITLQAGHAHPTGFFLSELAGPLAELERRGFKATFATPGGVIPAMDPGSDTPQWFSSPALYRKLRKQTLSALGRGPIRDLSGLSATELRAFDGLFVPGGHAPMEDLYRNAAFGRILRQFHLDAKPAALLCHGPVALLSAGRLYAGYRAAVFSTEEEKQVEGKGPLGGFVRFYPENALRKMGLRIEPATPWTSHVVRDRELITGQNPQSEKQFTDTFMIALEETRATRRMLQGFEHRAREIAEEAGKLLSFGRFGPAKHYPDAWVFATFPVGR